MVRASREKFSGKVTTAETFPCERASLALSESLRRVTLKGRFLEIPFIACVEINGNEGPISLLTIPNSREEEILAGSEGAVRLNIEKTSMIIVGTIIAGMNSLLRRKSEIEEGIILDSK